MTHSQSLTTKRLQMKRYRGLHIRQSLLVCITFADHDAFHTERVGDISIRVLLDNDLEPLHSYIISSDASARFMSRRWHVLRLKKRAEVWNDTSEGWFPFRGIRASSRNSRFRNLTN